MSASTGNAAWVLLAAVTMGAAALLARKLANTSPSQPFYVPSGLWNEPSDSSGPTSPLSPSIFLDWASIEPDQMTSALESVAVSLDPSTYRPANVPADVAATNVRAFLDVIAWSEGADYDVMFGGGRFASYADHPRQYFSFTDKTGKVGKTSAAGRYQFLARTWDGLVRKLGLPDFSPPSQDAGAIELIRERGALNDVKAGRITDAVRKCAPVWASFPGANYNQPERKLSGILGKYTQAGGTFEA